uniref:Secreted protein n=1 Tax=Rhabditophanes sp. KR3021 TaxID=114890 RepID=A0AC35U2N9_9BILA
MKSICLLLLLIIQALGQDGLELKQKAATRANNYASTFFTSEQYIELFDSAVAEIAAGKDPKAVGNSMMQKMMDLMSPEQYSAVMGFGASLTTSLGLTGMSTFMSKLSTCLGNNMSPFFLQIQEKLKTLQADPATTDLDVSRQAYLMALEFATPKRCETILCRFKKSFTSAQWSKMYSGLTKFLLVAKYNDNEECQF